MLKLSYVLASLSATDCGCSGGNLCFQSGIPGCLREQDSRARRAGQDEDVGSLEADSGPGTARDH